LYNESPGTSGNSAALIKAKLGMLDRRMTKVAASAAVSAPAALAGTSLAPSMAVALYPAQPSRPMATASAMVARSAGHTASCADQTGHRGTEHRWGDSTGSGEIMTGAPSRDTSCGQ
jgi:hypothetical protein